MPRDPLDDLIDMALEAEPLEFEIDDFDTPTGPPLTDDEIQQARQTLAQAQAPGIFKAITDALCARCDSKDWFNNPHLKFLHDAFVLARFARAQEAESVYLSGPSEQWPDGVVRLNGKERNVEVTSTHGGRRLGKEYREVTGPMADPVEDWIERADSIPKYLDEAIGAKAKKRYSSPCWLVVYLNISEYGIRQKETEAIIAETKARYAHMFQAISVLWKGKLY
jgi:hypothetical protein